MKEEVLIVTVVFNQVEMLSYQVDALRQHIQEDIEFLVVINSPWGPLREAFVDLSRALGIRAVVPPEDTRQMTHGSVVSRNHSAALNWVWKTIILPEHSSKMVAILDPDLFPLGPVSLSQRLRGRNPGVEGVGWEGEGNMCHVRGLLGGNVPCVGHCEPETYIAFMLPWLLLFDMASLPAKESINFDPIKYKGIQLDSGGALAAYFDHHRAFDINVSARLEESSDRPLLRVCSMHSYKADPDTTDFCLHQFSQLPLPDFIDGVFIHAQSLGSDWDVDYIEMGWGANGSTTAKEDLIEHSLSQMQMKTIKRKCVLDLVEDALANSIRCAWNDYQKHPGHRLPFPEPPTCQWTSL